jgi:microcystin-dependent protein
VAENASVVDGTVTWTVRKIGSGGGEAIGVIKAFAGNGDIPSGYLLCDGSAVSRTMFPDLFAAIGTTYGSGDGSTTFNVPDYNTAQRFAQGDTVAGVVKQAGVPNITGSMTRMMASNAHSFSGAFSETGFESTSAMVGSTAHNTYSIAFSAQDSNPIYGASNTVQPASLTVRYIIKAFDGQTADSALIDITQYAQELAGKANRQLSNLDTNNLSVHVVVDSYYDATTGDWWREYDDGWLEQGGHSLQGVSYTLTLLKPFADTQYTVVATCDTLSNSRFAQVDVKTETTIKFSIGTGGNNAMNNNHSTEWVAYGMGASV